MKKFACLLAVLSICTFVYGETMYMTIVSKEQAKPLAKTDITLRVDDKDIPITEFIPISSDARDLDLLAHPVARRSYVLVVDFLHMTPAQSLEVRKMAQDFVTRIPKEDLIAIAGFTNEDGLRLFSGFTTDRKKLISAWNAMGKVVLSGWVEGPEGNLYTSKFEQDEEPPQLIGDQEFLTNLNTYVVDAKLKEQLAPLYIQSFVDLSSLLSTMKGRKNVVLFSPGTDVKGLRVDLTEMKKEEKKEGEQTATGDHKTLRDITQLGPRDLQALAQEGPKTKRTRENDANVVSRLIEGADGHVYVFNPSAEDNGFLKDLSEKTKGSYNRLADFAAVSPQVLNSDQTFYAIGWDGVQEKTFHELHTIEIKSASVEIVAPSRWLAPKPVTDYSPLEKKAHLAQAIYKSYHTSDQYKFWSDVILDDGFNRVSAFTEVAGPGLLHSNSKELQLEFYGFAVEPDGTLIDFYNAPITLDLKNPKLRERLQKAGLKVWNVLFSGRGPVNIRTIVLNTLTGETITNTVRLSYKDTEFLLTNPFFPSSNFDWIFWPKPDQVQNRRGREILYPYRVGSDIFSPDLSPRIQAHEKGKVVYFKIYNFIPGDKYPSVRLRVLGENGTSVEIDRFGLMQQPRLVQRGGLELFWTIESMPSLTKGDYRLQVDVIDRKQNKEVIRDLLASVD